MNIRYHILSLLLIYSLALHGQEDCDIPELTHTILNDNVRAKIGLGGGIWRQPYSVPPNINQEAEVYPFFAGGLWLGGLDTEGNLKLAASTYGDYGDNFDYYNGPLNEDGYTTPLNCQNFEKFWPINKEDIDLFLEDFEDGYLDEFHTNIMRWPAKGNFYFQEIFGFPLPFQDLAPFVDQNGDDLYNPQHGDYPAIKGDEAVWWVFNDAGGPHQESQGDPIGTEIQVMAYTFDNQSQNISNTTFYDFKIINKSNILLDSFYTALFFDFDLGCYTDDYVGCNPEENLIYTYNEDALDGTTACTCDAGVQTYCAEIPLFGIKILNSPYNVFGQKLGMSSCMYYNNSPRIPFPGDTYDPNTPEEFYTYMKGLWPGGIPLTYGDDGYLDGEATKYAFPGNPADPDAWSMCSVDLPPGDRRFVIGSGPSDLDPGKAIELTYAFLYVPNVPHPCPDISPLIEAGREAQEVFNQVTSAEELKLEIQAVELYPNPIKDFGRLTLKDHGDQIKDLAIFNAEGMKLRQYNSVFKNIFELPTSNLPSGIYFYQIETKRGAWYADKFIIQ